FNADFDGDQMAVHLPLSIEAQVEASMLMLSTNNVFSPANGKPIIAPSQDIVLGCYYLTYNIPTAEKKLPVFASPMEVFQAHGASKVTFHSHIKVRLQDDDSDFKFLTPTGPVKEERGIYTTTVGRVYFNDILPQGMPYYNIEMSKSNLSRVIHDCYQVLGRKKTLVLLDDLKELGFKIATLSGLSFSKDDLRVPELKEQILEKTQKDVDRVEKQYQKGVITEGERYNQIIDLWTSATEKIGEEMISALKNDYRSGKYYINPIFMMVDSGSRGSSTQIRQLAGMRGLMAKPSGKIIETPIKASFREGLKVLEYFSSTHGARKGLADTALKTADSGYLTRKLADVAQNVVINEQDCGTLNGITKSIIYKGDKIEVPLWKIITGRVSRKKIVDVITDELIVDENQLITEDIAKRIESLGYEKVQVRSPLTCETRLGVCANCYGMDLSTGRPVEEGLAVGIIAAQSIGEPGTQLTMRTFHIGGIASKRVEETRINSKHKGKVQFTNLKVVSNPENKEVALNRNGEILIMDEKGRELERHVVPAGAILHVADGQDIKAGTNLLEWEPHMIPILAEKSGIIEYDDIIEGATMKVETDSVSKKIRRQIIEHKGDLHPQIIIVDEKGDRLGVYPIPEKAYLEIEHGQKISAGTLIAKTPREITGTQDITGGLPRVTEIFEVRRPKDPAVIAEIDGNVEFGEKKRGKSTIIIRNESGMEVDHLIPHGKHFRVHKGDMVRAGEPLVDGPLVPKDILRISGEEAVQQYLLREVQNVYRSQNVTIDDKHIEVIISQMLRNVHVVESGDTDILPGTVMDKFRFRAYNQEIIKQGKKPATAEPLLLGITKASLQSESFISAASFQETTKVLTEAAIAGKTDNLLGLKENVILGHLVPSGTGFKAYHDKAVKKLGEPVEELELHPVMAEVQVDPLTAAMKPSASVKEEVLPVTSDE
ncbi:MAG: DNA-directed RNA polymerase subunit beta', partial [Planctomycetes bacterium]|nr:DNA-directed RNA polymerase subunit beta' [Planctomycetota bacterium]